VWQTCGGEFPAHLWLHTPQHQACGRALRGSDGHPIRSSRPGRALAGAIERHDRTTGRQPLRARLSEGECAISSSVIRPRSATPGGETARPAMGGRGVLASHSWHRMAADALPSGRASSRLWRKTCRPPLRWPDAMVRRGLEGSPGAGRRLQAGPQRLGGGPVLSDGGDEGRPMAPRGLLRGSRRGGPTASYFDYRADEPSGKPEPEVS
jgi:hypothetical protein